MVTLLRVRHIRRGHIERWNPASIGSLGHQSARRHTESPCNHCDILCAPADLPSEFFARNCPCNPKQLTKLLPSEMVGEEVLVHSEAQRLIEGHFLTTPVCRGRHRDLHLSIADQYVQSLTIESRTASSPQGRLPV